MSIRHFVFFRQGTGEWVREWKGPVPEQDIPTSFVGDAREAALNEWATSVSQPAPDEVGLDVTHIGWPVGDFCYCTFDEVDRCLDWGPSRYYIEVRLDTLDIVANQESHRPLPSSVPGQIVIDITGTPLEPLHGSLFGRIVRRNGAWVLKPSPQQRVQLALTERTQGLDAFDDVLSKEPVLVESGARRRATTTPPRAAEEVVT